MIMFIALGLLSSVLTFVPSNNLQFFTYDGYTSYINALPNINNTIGENAGVIHYQFEFTRDNNFPETGVEYEFNLGSFTLKDGDTYYQNYLRMSLSYQYNSPVDFGWTVTVAQYDFDSPYGTFPILNYELYSSVDYSMNYGNSYTSVVGDNIFPLVYNVNEIYINANSQIMASNLKLRLNMNFLYMSHSVFDPLVDGLLSASGGGLYSIGYDNGYRNGVNDGVQQYIDSQQYADILQNEYDDGKQEGIGIGRQEVIDSGQTASIIFNGIISIGLLPTNVFLRMLNFEVFGINIGAFVSSLLTIMIIIIISRMLFGGKGGNDS